MSNISSTPEYRAYVDAQLRCDGYKHKHQSYIRRGILFRFVSFEQFLAEVGYRPERHPTDGPYSLDRINNDGHYEPGNVRWATRKEQHASQIRTGWKEERIKAAREKILRGLK